MKWICKHWTFSHDQGDGPGIPGAAGHREALGGGRRDRHQPMAKSGRRHRPTAGQTTAAINYQREVCPLLSVLVTLLQIASPFPFFDTCTRWYRSPFLVFLMDGATER